MDFFHFLNVAEDLEIAGLIWQPEIGDEVAQRDKKSVSILVDPQGMSPSELRTTYLWLPTVEQMVMQFEGRQVILYHAGLELTPASVYYKTVIHSSALGEIESKGASLREAMGMALRDLLLADRPESIN